MATLANFKNFIRHGKQARQPQGQPHAEPTTNVSTVNAQQQRHVQPPQNAQYAFSDPNLADRQAREQHAHQAIPGGDFSAANVDQRNRAAQAGDVAARAAGNQQKINDMKAEARNNDVDPSVIERIVAEERESQGKLPNYPGLERWTLIEKMGDGAFSNVYRARDTTGKYGEVAIKVVRKFEMNSTHGDEHLHQSVKKQHKVVERGNILKEVSIMRQIDHPSIVQLLDFSESRQYYYIVLELAPGGELFHQIVRLTYFSEELSRHVIIQVAQALEYLHETAGVVHRDIKPENLLFYPVPFIPTRNPKPKGPEDEDKADEGEFVPGVGAGGIGQIKIADFGLSKIIWDSQTMTPCGTVGYTAPEIVKDERYSKSVDMWALGCVLYTLLCGFPPFYDESIQVLTEKVARGQYTFLSPWWDDISKSAQDLISHLLTVNPDKRYTIKQFLEHPWIRESQEETSAAADAPPLATPLHMRQQAPLGTGYQGRTPGSAIPSHMMDPSPGEQVVTTPGGSQRRADFRSPGAVNLREVFDVSYAVHRAEEEGKRRKNFPQGYRGAAGMNGLNALNEDDYDEDELDEADHQDGASKAARPADVSSVEQKMRTTNLDGHSRSQQQQQQQQGGGGNAGGYGQHSAAVAQAAKREVRERNRGRARVAGGGGGGGAFELSLDNATLLGRRGNQGGANKNVNQAQGQAQASKLREQVVQ